MARTVREDRVSPRKETINDVLTHVFGQGWRRSRRFYNWPPYSFLAAAIILKRSGAYRRVLDGWPPAGKASNWDKAMKRLGSQWRISCDRALIEHRNCVPPRRILELWAAIRTRAKTPLFDLAEEKFIADALIELLAAADESAASLGIAVSAEGDKTETFRRIADQFLYTESTLTPFVAKSIASVLPKQHTPNTGITLRSMSHHLALHAGADARAIWNQIPRQYGSNLNILLAPWPLVIKPKQYVESRNTNLQLTENFKSFDYIRLSDPDSVAKWLEGLLARAEDVCDRIDLVVFPEAALDAEEFGAGAATAQSHGAFLLGGVMSHRPDDTAANQVWLKMPYLSRIVQDKHHRWLFTGKQIEMYGLGGALDPNYDWWENTAVESRCVNFVEIDAKMTMCCLVCEDLARQEPVAELVRAVGPNLVIALLSDAPQLRARWPARYATVLADDPGCSVLTVTSLGMAELSKPPIDKPRRRSIALWKDFFGDAEEIELPVGKEAAILHLRATPQVEWTADGRSDRGVASYPRLVGTHFV